MARIAALEARVRQYDDTIARHRTEILQQLETHDERRIARENQLESLRTIDQRKVEEELEKLRIRFKELDRVNETLETRKREELRLSRALDGIEKKVDQAESAIESETRLVVGIREAREKDFQRINELESRTSAFVKRVDEQRGLIDSSEDQLQKLATRA
ncbi:MAG: hypothetical protein ACC647_10380, partial [Anaerolineales bacterium]